MHTVVQQRTAPLLRAVILALAACLALVSLTGLATAGHRSQSGLYLFPDATPVPRASASLVRSPNGVSMNLTTVGLDLGAAYTVWWVVFNNPEFCENPIGNLTTCGEADLFIPEVEASVLFAAGHIVGASGRGSFAHFLMAGDLSGCQEPFASFGLCGDGLTNPGGAEIHLIVRSHDTFIPSMLPGMIHTFAGACTAESSLGAGDGPNTCADKQFAAFVP